MEKILRKEFGFSPQAKIRISASLIVFLLVSVCVFTLLNNNIREVVHRDAEKNIANISELNSNAIYKELTSRQKLLQSIAESLGHGVYADKERLLDRLRIYADNYEFYNIGILTLDGMLSTTTGEKMDVSSVSPYSNALNGEPLISESFMSADGDGYKLNALTMPVYNGKKMVFILTGTYRSRDLAEVLNISSYDGKGFSFVINADGEAVVYPVSGEDEDYLDLIAYINNQSELTPKGKKDRKGQCFMYQDEEYYAHYDELGINDWYLMTCVKESDVFNGTRLILNVVYVGMGFLWVLIGIILSSLLFQNIRYQRKMQRIIFEDPLLKEKNFEYLRIYFPQITREERSRMAFLVLDVDKFKEFNFLYGSKYGDKLLKYISSTFHEELDGDRLYRYVSDQFAGLIVCRDRQEAEEKLRRFQEHIEKDIEEKKIRPFKISMGICMMKDYDILHVVYSDAMIAKNTVKGNSVRKYAFYDAHMRQESMTNMEMESAFRDALHNQEFQVYYQPKYDMRNGRIVGSEALVRWRKPDGTMIPPGEFIPCFEANGQIVLLDEAMLENVCRQMKEMERDGLPVCQVSVNLSRLHLKYQGITEKIGEMLKRTGIDPSKLAIEVTESVLYDDNIPLAKIVSELHALGCQVNMDDYGTGISSLSSLANIDFDVLKLDKSFVDKIGDKKMESVIKSTIRLADDLGMMLIAEGVEEKRQTEFLKEQGCFYAQGFYYSRPVSEKEYRKMLRDELER